MTKKALLIFPNAVTQSRTSRNGFGSKMHLPQKEHQINSFDQKITNIQRVLDNEAANLRSSPSDMVAEMILVLEIAGDLKDFFNAVRLTPGMEFLAEQQTELFPDENFYTIKDGERSEKPFGGRLFLTMTNHRALRELLGYWREYKKEGNLQNWRYGTKKFKNLFDKLKDLRPYSVSDRLKDTGFSEYLAECAQLGIGDLHFEIELAFKKHSRKNQEAYDEIVSLIKMNNGSDVPGSRTLIPEINYHAFIAKAPIVCFNDISENTNIKFLKAQQILYFRPVGQSIFKFSEEPEVLEEVVVAPIEIRGEPVIALLDGLPLENHDLLSGKLIIDDPDEFARNYIASQRIHGTAMASIILNGDYAKDNASLLGRPIYVRPIMKPNIETFNNAESLPIDRLPIDLIHRAVKRMFDGEQDTNPTAPNVKIINFSIGDPFRPFHINISTWAKLLDWLSFKYNVLFIISAGNAPENIELNFSEENFALLSEDERQRATLEKIIEGNYYRKILTPAESINSLTVGASHNDSSILTDNPQRFNLLKCKDLFSPISRIGHGFNRSVKPEFLMHGGRKLYRKPLFQADPNKTKLTLEDSHPLIPPGIKTALPGDNGRLNMTGYICGTSNSAALTTNLAGHLYEMLLELNEGLEDNAKIPSNYFTVILKSLLSHSANWGEAYNILNIILRHKNDISSNTIKRNIYQYLGYGCIDSEKILYCTDQRVTLIGFGSLSKKDGANAHLYTFPLPSSIGQINIHKRLVITLAWLTPLNFNSTQYRKAHLFFDTLQHNEHLSLERENYDFLGAQKGTLQHDVLIGKHADAFIDGANLNIKVNCRDDASGLSINEQIPYAITVTLEVNENSGIAIYEEVKTRLQQRIRPAIS